MSIMCSIIFAQTDLPKAIFTMPLHMCACSIAYFVREKTGRYFSDHSKKAEARRGLTMRGQSTRRRRKKKPKAFGVKRDEIHCSFCNTCAVHCSLSLEGLITSCHPKRMCSQ